MKIYRLIKTVLFGLSGILVMIFANTFIKNGCEYLPILVGSVMAYYGAEAVITSLIKPTKSKAVKLLNGSITLLLGIIVFTRIGQMQTDLTIVCVLWGVWAISREGEEIYEKVIETWDVKPVSILNAVESVVVICFSVMLILNPVEHHVYTHVIILGIELLLEIIWGHLYNLFGKIKKEKNN